MKALVVYESMFGNTRAVAERIAEGLTRSAPDLIVTTVEIGHLQDDAFDGVTLLVLGCPTHAFGMPTAGSRQSALEQAGEFALVSHGDGIREFLPTLDSESCGVFATFDTHTTSRWVPGSASRKVAKALERRGLTPLADPASFYVEGVKGPLDDGEEDRARAWGGALGTALLQGYASAHHAG